LINAIVLSIVSNSGADSEAALPLLPTTSADSTDARAARLRRFHLILDLAIVITDDKEDKEDDFSIM
jgi:hypothetical protein